MLGNTVLGIPLDRGGWFLREHHIEVVTRVENIHALSSIIVWMDNNCGCANFKKVILHTIRVHIGPYHACQHKHFSHTAPCSLPVHTRVCNILLYRGCCNSGFNKPVINRSEVLNYTAAQFKVLVFRSCNYVAEGTKETVAISDNSTTKCWVSELNIWTTYITCMSTNKPQAQFLTHPTLPLFRHRVKPVAVIYILSING